MMDEWDVEPYPSQLIADLMRLVGCTLQWKVKSKEYSLIAELNWCEIDYWDCRAVTCVCSVYWTLEEMILFAEAERWTDKELERVRKLSQVSSVRHCQYLFICSWQKLVFQTTTVSCQPGEKCGYCREPELLKTSGFGGFRHRSNLSEPCALFKRTICMEQQLHYWYFQFV